MPRSVFERFYEGVAGRGLFVWRRDATNKEEISPRIKIIAALRILAYGKIKDEMDELCEMSRTFSWESFIRFVDELIMVVGAEYLRVMRGRSEADSCHEIPTRLSRMRRKPGLRELGVEELPGCLVWEVQEE